MKPLLSIIIATKNRVPYCINSIETILNTPGNDFELVVQDNTDNTELKDYIKANISDSRLIYNYTPPPYSFIDNFNTAIYLASGEYLCLIGDDDSICRQLLDIVLWARKRNIDSLSPQKLFEYIWPDTFNNQKDSTLIIFHYDGQIKKLDPDIILNEFFSSGALDYLKKGFPKLYHGIVRKTCLDEVKAKTGFYVGGLSPDIYAAIALSFVVKSHYVIDLPITIAGACKASATAASVKGQHSGELKKAPHFRDRGNYIWDSLMPDIYSVETIWAETSLKALSDMGREDLRREFNLHLFLAKNILRNLDKWRYFIIQTYSYLISNKNGFLSVIKLFFVLFYLTIKYFISNIPKLHKSDNKNLENIIYKDVHDLKHATALSSELLGQNMAFQEFSKDEN